MMSNGWYKESYRHHLAAKGIKTNKYLARTPIGSTVENIMLINARQKQKVKAQGELPELLKSIQINKSLRTPLTNKEQEAVQIIMDQIGSSTIEKNDSSNLKFFSEYDPSYEEQEENRLDVIIKKFTTRIENNKKKIAELVRENEDAGKTDEANIEFKEKLKEIGSDNKIAYRVIDNYKKEKENLRKINTKYVNGVDLTIRDRMILGGLVKKARGVNK